MAKQKTEHNQVIHRPTHEAYESLSERCPQCGAKMVVDVYEEFVPLLGRRVHREFPHCTVCEAREKLRQERSQRRERRTKRRDFLAQGLVKVIPPCLRHARIGRVPARLRQALRSRKPGESLYLWGPVGGGKSYTMAAFVRDMIIRMRGGANVARISHAAIDQRLRHTFAHHSAQSELDVLRPFLRADILWLEDLGSGVTPSPFSQRTLEMLVEHRIEQCVPTLVTSNWSVEQIETQCGPRIGSRLCTYKIIKLQGRDRRKTTTENQSKTQDAARSGGLEQAHA